ncbi:MAG: VOC family protein, partial [Lewinella sp.]
MLTSIQPKLPMRDKSATHRYYVDQLGFELAGTGNYDDYLMVKRDSVEIHFFSFAALRPTDNYGQVYIRTDNIDALYASL